MPPDHREYPPPPTLKHAIKCFWSDTIEAGELPSPVEILPDGCAEIIFHFGGICGTGKHRLPSPFMMGLLTEPVTLQARGRVSILAIRCYPWAVFDLLGLPAVSDSVRIFEHPIARLQHTLASCVEHNRIEEALHHLAQHLSTTSPPCDIMLERAGAAMREANGTLPVHAVAAAAHATVRTLERRFKQSAGRTVKEVSNVMRFEQVRNALFAQPTASIASLASTLGYADQSHLNREFRRYAGTTPAAFARRRRPGVDIVGFVQA